MHSPHHHFRNTTLIIDNAKAFHKVLSTIQTPLQAILISDNPFVSLQKNSHLTNNISTTSCKRVNQYLGQEFNTVAFEATEHFNVNAFAAICGCIVGGGELILHLPSEYRTIDNNLQTHIATTTPVTSHLLMRFIKTIIQYQTTRWSYNAINWFNGSNAVINDPHTKDLNLYLAQQKDVIEKVKRCCLGHAKRPVILTADRGRGKSSCLGIAAAELMIENNKRILITSPRKENTHILIQHAKNTLQEHSLSDKISQLTFIAPDKLLNKHQPCDLLMIDEAGAIPVQILEHLIQQYNRVLFSTTVNGYEGNGLGFKIRFKSFIERQYSQYKSVTLEAPVRWAKNDPLENSINLSFLLDHSINNFDAIDIKQIKHNAIKQTLIKKIDLIKNEAILKDLFSLLTEAHYQTRPSDLERILSDPKISVFASLYQGKVIAAALVSAEGSISSEQCHQIEQGELRLKGHLLPQSLMAYQGDRSAGQLKFWRIMRIAVTPLFLRENIATQLISFIEKEAISLSIDIIGASFSMTPLVLSFWYNSNYQCSRIALKKDSSTGSTPADFLKTLDKNIQSSNIFNRSIKYFGESFYYSLQSNYKNLSPNLLLIIIENQQPLKKLKLQPSSLLEIKRYIEKARSYEMVEWHINQLILSQLINRKTINRLLENEKTLLIAKSLQCHHWEFIVKQFNFKGKKTAKEAFQNIINKLASIDAS